MSIPDDVIKKIESEFEEEIKKVKGPSDGVRPTFSDLENQILEIRNRFGQKLMEAALKYQGEGEIAQKKTARNAKGN